MKEYRPTNFLPLNDPEARYDTLPPRKINAQAGINRFCLAQTVNLAKFKNQNRCPISDRTNEGLSRLENMLTESRGWAVKSLKIK